MAVDDIVEFLTMHKGERIALVSHQRPDGDALGSTLGLAAVLRGRGYTAHVVNATPIPPMYDFIRDADLLRRYDSADWFTQYDCLGVMDCGDLDRLEPINCEAGRRLPAFTIDHHVSSGGVGEGVWLDPEASSTGEMVVRLCQAAGWPLGPYAAQALWVAVCTDTGRFSYENTDAAALAAALACVEAGAQPAAAAQHLYQSIPRPVRTLQSRAMARLEFHAGGKLAVTWLRQQDFADAGIGVEGAQDMVNVARDTAGVLVAIFLYELPAASSPNGAGVKASLRTIAPYDSLLVSRQFAGGGHVRASGCTVTGAIDAAKKTIVDAALKAYFPEAVARPAPL